MPRNQAPHKRSKEERICRYCGWNIDEPDLEILTFLHSDCWKEYRRNNLLYPMPGLV